MAKDILEEFYGGSARKTKGWGSPAINGDRAVTAGDTEALDAPPEAFDQPEERPGTREKIERMQKMSESMQASKSPCVDPHELPATRVDYARELNSSQLASVATTQGPLLVIAGAGTGKTRTVSYRVGYLLENGVPPERILLLTFTRKAASEMLSRTQSLLGDDRAGRVTGGTFHSFGNHILRKLSGLLNISPNFTVINAQDSQDIISLIREDYKTRENSKFFPRKSRIQDILSRARNCRMSIEEVLRRDYYGLLDYLEDLQGIVRDYQNYKKDHHMLDYDDLIDFVVYSMRKNERFRDKVQSMFDYVMVDEYQDTNLAQKELVDLLCEKHRNLMVVGDDMQSIYAFRGANLENILFFPESYPDCSVVRIEKNYRSSPEILSFSNDAANKAAIGYKKHLHSDLPNTRRPTFSWFEDQEEEAQAIVQSVLSYRETGVELFDMAVLYRATFHGNYIQAELMRRGVPYVVYGGIKFVERRHVRDVIAYLRVALNQTDAASWNRILRLLPGIGDKTAREIVHGLAEKGMDFSGYCKKKFYTELMSLKGLVESVMDPQVSVPEKVDLVRDYYLPILKQAESDHEIRALDIDFLREVATKYKDLEKFLTDFALDPPSKKFQDKTTPLVDESEEDPLVLSTVHSAKGLEWRAVFMPHLLDGMFPSSRCMTDTESLEEERRLFYVAVTRAREYLHLSAPFQVFQWDAVMDLPSRFLCEADAGRVEILSD